jgi:hypothetical protein
MSEACRFKITAPDFEATGELIPVKGAWFCRKIDNEALFCLAGLSSVEVKLHCQTHGWKIERLSG